MGQLYMTLTMNLFFVMAREENSTYGTVIPSWRMICTGELKAIQMQWSKPAYIPQNNIESANPCSISQQAAWLRPKALPSLGIFLGNILNTHTFQFLYHCHVLQFCPKWTLDNYLVTISKCHDGNVE